MATAMLIRESYYSLLNTVQYFFLLSYSVCTHYTLIYQSVDKMADFIIVNLMKFNGKK